MADEGVGELNKGEFLWPVRVYYEDTDAGGVVFYANYLNFMERARTEMLRSFGFEQDTLKNEQGLLFAVHSLSVQYQKPAIFNDELIVKTVITLLGKASLYFRHIIIRKNDMIKLCEAEVKVACMTVDTFKPKALPKNIFTQLKEVMHGS